MVPTVQRARFATCFVKLDRGMRLMRGSLLAFGVVGGERRP